ncbi:MAG: hypothetical protein DCF19_11105 [Pseudanabaena frigida]|uniref:Uncharacterized protein n=1 Tax=Pseudanabaena frigida TaxID=945775 RepID=A0A2W4WFZ6_9CYAN|nr:MAG: hypothetical protein DCF19_11105 [Pseudanabaena frigida]
MEKSRNTSISKFLSKYLRHEPEKLGLQFERTNFIIVEE